MPQPKPPTATDRTGSAPPHPAPPGFWADLKTRLKAHTPTRETLARQRWLGPLAHRLAEPRLWRMKPEAVARGVAIGLFWAFMVPFAQIVFAVAHCVWWRGNIPVAAGVTLITNPFTIGGWLYLAYQAGSFFVGPADGAAPGDPALGLLDMLQSFGWPTAVGMALFALGGSLSGYLLTRTLCKAWFHWRVARRARRRRAA
jgi:uncharacterized protein (DUF2062 family)